MTGAGHQPAGATPFTIEPEQPFAGIKLLAIMAWPHDAEQRRQALSALGADILDQIEEDGERRAQQEMEAALAEAAAKHGMTLEDMQTLPEFSAFAEIIREDFISYARDAAEAQVYAPAGGRSTLKKAASLASIMDRLRRVSRLEGKMVGKALIYQAALAKFHPDIPPSFLRAWVIMAVEDAAGLYTIPAGHKNCQKVWTDWKCVAHLFAALNIWVRAQTGPAPDLVDHLSKPEELATILAWASWFRGWATATKVPNSKEVYILETDAVAIAAKVPVMEPPLHPLSDFQIFAAKSYTHGHSKDFDPSAVLAAARRNGIIG
ncbi:hypothetical protein [Roseomonas gilardii]|uniref:hypothetical protein n=1 Tax=Roseomonas gilardii TaxID=257708 RepID=UPI00048728EB|nr:hypothetical protein [Roseomonas gilardii]SUE43901.1 Uncharacterised protein [Roseomonas gilardii subsp. rosea]